MSPYFHSNNIREIKTPKYGIKPFGKVVMGNFCTPRFFCKTRWKSLNTYILYISAPEIGNQCLTYATEWKTVLAPGVSLNAVAEPHPSMTLELVEASKSWLPNLLWVVYTDFTLTHAIKQGNWVTCLFQTGFAAFELRAAAHQWVPLCWNRTTFPTNLANW